MRLLWEIRTLKVLRVCLAYGNWVN
jgi:hypothetical protein